MNTISLEQEDGHFVITDAETGVTTQGETKFEALLMLADALAAHEESDEDLLATALDVFVPDPTDREFRADLADESYEPPELSDEQIRKQREAALWLAKSHKKTDYSEPTQFGMLLSLVYGRTHSLSIDQLDELLRNGYWDVFEAIATGTQTVEALTTQLNLAEDRVRSAIQTLEQRELIARAADERLFAAHDVVGVSPYPIDGENIIDWELHYEHTLVRTLEADEIPSTAEEGVIVERLGTGYGWYHDPASYKSYWTDEVVMSRADAEENGSNACPRCFPTSEHGEQFDVTELPGGVTRYERTDIPDEKS